MKLNWSSCVLIPNQCIALFPYRQRYVAQYHAWMEDETLREMTASERLSIEEELKNQKSWIADPEKMTFIIFKLTPPSVSGGSSSSSILTSSSSSEVSLSSSSSSSSSNSAAAAAADAGPTSAAVSNAAILAHPTHLLPPSSAMIGDVNIFMLREFQSIDYLLKGGEELSESSASAPSSSSSSSTNSSSSNASASVKQGVQALQSRICEVMIMIAVEHERRKGHAIHALVAIMKYGMDHLGLTTFVAKITQSNKSSISLFTEKLGFVLVKSIADFEEDHFVAGPGQRIKETIDRLSKEGGYLESLCAGEDGKDE